MSIKIGDVDLDKRLLLRGLFDSPKIATVVKTTLSGQKNYYNYPVSGRELTLTTDGPNGVKYGFFTRGQLEALQVIRDSGTRTTLTHHTETFSVIIPSDGIQVMPVIESTLKNKSDLFSGSILLKEV